MSSVWSEALATGERFSTYIIEPEYGCNSPAVNEFIVAVLPLQVTF